MDLVDEPPAPPRAIPARHAIYGNWGGGHAYCADIKAANKVEGEAPRVLADTRFLLGRY